MLSEKTDDSKSQTAEALVPLIDLFAVLALVFMLYSSQEIIDVKQETEEKIEEFAAQVEIQKQVEEQKRAMAKDSNLTLEAIKKHQEEQAKQLMQKFAQLLAVEQTKFASQYEDLVVDIEVQHEKQKEQLEEERKQQLAEAEQEYQQAIAKKESELEEKKQKAL
ncbi:MAG: hypothetical protein OEX19_05275, partial [Gammaproteobacteria bacterium]|nr:hypothetical protein [Gammaproteobacteria bacterium]